MRICSGMLLCLALLPALPAAAADGLVALRVAPPVTLLRGGEPQSFVADLAIRDGDGIRTGNNARAALQLDRGSIVTLGDDAELYVHSVDAARGRAALARMVLNRGALRVDAITIPGLGSQDFRINAGRLRVRIYGAEAFIELNQDSESVCLLRGAIEVQAGDGKQARVDDPGDCLALDRGGNLMRIQPNPQTLLARLDATDFDRRHYSAPPQAAAQASTVKPSAAKPPQAAPAPGTWTVVIGSFGDAESATLEAAALREQGYAAEVHTATREGQVLNRIGIGRFDSADAARAYAQTLKQRMQISNAWIMQF